MRRLTLLAVLLPLLAATPAGAKVSCGDGVPMFADGRLRVFGVPFSSRDEWGANHYACFGGRRPQLVGSDYDNAGTGSAHTLVYAHAGIRGHAGGAGGHRLAADLVGDVAAVEQHAVADADVGGGGDRGGLVLAARGSERDRPVHRPRVQVREADPLGDGAGNGRLPGPRGAVDGDHHGE